ncbi:MAG TPA: DEAD/DEAH box helicase [Thermodesulfobacteriota bacterium]|nr:DEAD/DEAH box helicase [Thermodesulfobacteriota bacterium]
MVQNATVIMPPLVEVPPEPGKRRFADFDIATEVLSGIQDLGFQYCTPIQEQCLPHALAGRDITGRAQTGTGKTAAFLTAILTYLLRNPKKGRKPGSCRVLVLAPTRELAIQIFDDAQALGKYCGFENLVVFGGMGYQKQREALQKPIDILVGTPGRVIDYSTSGHLDLSKTEIVVIDEADRMLDMGFIPDVRRIVQKAPPPGKRQTMFFSATLTSEIISLVDRWLINPVRIETETENVVTDLIEQTFYSVSCSDKLALILWILKNDSVKRMLVFCNRKDSAQKLASALQRHGIQSGVLSGDIPQEKRLRILDEFRNDKKSVIVATDVAARGIHVDSVSHVVLYDLPQDPEAYVHRVGRTGRAGETGKSIGFACEYGAHLIPELEQFLGCRIACINPTEEMLVLPAMPAGTSTIKTVNADSRPSRHNRSRRSWRVKPSSVPKSTA